MIAISQGPAAHADDVIVDKKAGKGGKGGKGGKVGKVGKVAKIADQEAAMADAMEAAKAVAMEAAKAAAVPAPGAGTSTDNASSDHSDHETYETMSTSSYQNTRAATVDALASCLKNLSVSSKVKWADSVRGKTYSDVFMTPINPKEEKSPSEYATSWLAIQHVLPDYAKLVIATEGIVDDKVMRSVIKSYIYALWKWAYANKDDDEIWAAWKNPFDIDHSGAPIKAKRGWHMLFKHDVPGVGTMAKYVKAEVKAKTGIAAIKKEAKEAKKA